MIASFCVANSAEVGFTCAACVQHTHNMYSFRTVVVLPASGYLARELARDNPLEEVLANSPQGTIAPARKSN